MPQPSLPSRRGGVTAIKFALDGQDLHGLHFFLILDVALDDSQRRPSTVESKIGVGPKRRKAGSQPPKLVSRQPRRFSLIALTTRCISNLRIDLDQDMGVVRQNRDLKHDPVRYPPLHAVDSYLAPIFRTKD